MKNSSAVCLSPDGAIAQTASRDCRPTARASSANRKLLAPLRAGDDSVLSELVRRYHGPLLRLALVFLPSEALAEEVVQDTWTAVVEGLTSFEGRSSFKTWIFRILTHRAKTRLRREARSVPFSALKPCDWDEAAVDQTRFVSDGHWAEPPRSFTDESPEKQLIRKEAISCLERALRQFPLNQRAAGTLRDVEGIGAAEVSNIRGIREWKSPVLLHHERQQLRR